METVRDTLEATLEEELRVAEGNEVRKLDLEVGAITGGRAIALTTTPIPDISVFVVSFNTCQYTPIYSLACLRWYQRHKLHCTRRSAVPTSPPLDPKLNHDTSLRNIRSLQLLGTTYSLGRTDVPALLQASGYKDLRFVEEVVLGEWTPDPPQCVRRFVMDIVSGVEAAGGGREEGLSERCVDAGRGRRSGSGRGEGLTYVSCCSFLIVDDAPKEATSYSRLAGRKLDLQSFENYCCSKLISMSGGAPPPPSSPLPSRGDPPTIWCHRGYSAGVCRMVCSR